MDSAFLERLLNQIRFCKRAGSKNVFFKTRFDTRMTPLESGSGGRRVGKRGARREVEGGKARWQEGRGMR